MTRIPTRRSPFRRYVDLSSWILGCLTASLFFALHALVDDVDHDAVPAQQLEDVRMAQEDALALAGQVGAIAREAHAQGMREALAAAKGTPDGDALQKTCGRLWSLEDSQ